MSRTLSQGRRRGFAGVLPFMLGAPVAVGLLWLALTGPLRGGLIERYLSHPVEWAEMVLFCVALVALALRFGRLGVERTALRRELLPVWNGEPVPSGEAARLQELYRCQPRRLRETLLGQRVASVLDYLLHRRSAAGLDDHLRTLADNDALAQESAGALTRFITWAIPILGFLGTVLGVTDAVAGITPEQLEKSLNTVTDGLALAFDTTALALTLTMVLMLISSTMDRLEQNLLEDVDRWMDEQVAHRFERHDGAGSDAGIWRQAMEELVRRQAGLWADALAQTDRRHAEAEAKLHDKLQASLSAALDRALEAHGKRLAELEKQSAKHLGGLIARIDELNRSAAGHADLMRKLHESEKHLLVLQQTLQQNLQTLAGAGAFEQAVHSLTAAIHLLTSQTVTGRARPGAAA